MGLNLYGCYTIIELAILELKTKFLHHYEYTPMHVPIVILKYFAFNNLYFILDYFRDRKRSRSSLRRETHL